MHEILRLDLSGSVYQWEYLNNDPLVARTIKYYYSCAGSELDNKLYIFGGVSLDGHENNLILVDLADNLPVLSELSTSENVPTARVGHAMEAHSGSLFIFGGKKYDGSHLIDIWRYDLKLHNWEPYPVKSKQPLGRDQFAHTKKGDIIFIFGGEGESGLLEDMHLLNLNTNIWEEIQAVSKTNPSARKGACMTTTDDSILIFGGKTSAGYNNELWKFEFGSREFENLNPEGIQPPLLAYSRCKTYTQEDGNVILYVYYGETTGNSAQSCVYSYDFREKKWTKIRDKGFEYVSKSSAAVEYLNNRIIVAGGSQHGYKATNEIYDIDLTTQKITLLGRLPRRIYSAGMVYFEDKLYIQGGGYSFEALAIPIVPVHDFYVVDLNKDCNPELQFCGWDCSKGTFTQNGVCNWCPLGSYNENEGSEICKLCKAGYYENGFAADSYTKCMPCDKGSYNSLPGQSYCLDCPSTQDCPVSSNSPKDYNFDIKSKSSQPKIYETNSSEVEYYNEIIAFSLCMIFVVLFILIIFIQNTKKQLRYIDIYISKHNYQIESPMYLRKTVIGGIFSLFSYAIVLGVIGSSVSSYVNDNIAESKVLVPMVALEEKYDKFEAEQMIFEFRFFDYGDECVMNNTCTSELQVQTLNLQGDFLPTYCEKINSDCFIRIQCNNCELLNSGSVSVDLTENLSFATELMMNVTISSSIPTEYSSITSYISNPSDAIFRGIDSSIFYLTLTPSIFISELDDWNSEQTGYHISVSQSALEGSLIGIDEIQITKNLKAMISLDKDQAVLMTSRYQIQTYYLFLGSLAGSILGIIGAIGFLMKSVERIYLKRYAKKLNEKVEVSSKKHMKMIKNCFDDVKKDLEENEELRDEPHFNSLDSMYLQGNMSLDAIHPKVEEKYCIDQDSSFTENQFSTKNKQDSTGIALKDELEFRGSSRNPRVYPINQY